MIKRVVINQKQKATLTPTDSASLILHKCSTKVINVKLRAKSQTSVNSLLELLCSNSTDDDDGNVDVDVDVRVMLSRC